MSSHDFTPNLVWLPRIAHAVTHWAQFYNRYEIRGLENIPQTSGALMVCYHGLVPIDFWYFGLSLYLHTERPLCALTDRWLHQVPGLRWFTRSVGGVNANAETARELLRQGVLVGVSPGGVKEAIKGAKKSYQLVWGNRKGFARLAKESGCPLIPVFTENIEQSYRAPFAGHRIFQKIYEVTRLPLVPIVGLGPLPFPVKLISHIGPPIWPEEDESDEELALRTRLALEALIQAHQPANRSIWSAIKQRWQ